MEPTSVQRAELEEADPAVLLEKLRQAGPGRGASVTGFQSGEIPRGIVEDFLAGRYRHDRDAREQAERAEVRREIIQLWVGVIGSGLIGLAGLILSLLK
jgi:hypothetical protein